MLRRGTFLFFIEFFFGVRSVVEHWLEEHGVLVEEFAESVSRDDGSWEVVTS